MSRKRRKISSEEEVQLNLAAMLDMAFQLLTFFILTFKPMPVESQISLRMPPPQAINSPNAKIPPGNKAPPSAVQGFNTLKIYLFSDEHGKLTSIHVEQKDVSVTEDSLANLDETLRGMLNNPGTPFDQVVIQVPSQLHYYEVLRVMGVCSKQTVGGDPKNKLSKLSLVDETNTPSQ